MCVSFCCVSFRSATLALFKHNMADGEEADELKFQSSSLGQHQGCFNNYASLEEVCGRDRSLDDNKASQREDKTVCV